MHFHESKRSMAGLVCVHLMKGFGLGELISRHMGEVSQRFIFCARLSFTLLKETPQAFPGFVGKGSSMQIIPCCEPIFLGDVRT